MASLPYITVPPFDTGITVFGAPLVIQPFGALVVTGILVGMAYAVLRARALDIPAHEMRGCIFWAVAAGFLGSYLVELFVYHPHRFREDPLRIFYFWQGMSSFGGFVGGAVGVGLYLRSIEKPITVHGEVIAQALTLGFTIGRIGCSVVHDHPGTPSGFFLAVDFPDTPRHDLGLYELAWLVLVVLPAFLLTSRRQRRHGTSLAVILLLYTPGRFLLDFLREDRWSGGDIRYGGLTPAQYACIGFFLIAVGLSLKVLRGRTPRVHRADD